MFPVFSSCLSLQDIGDCVPSQRGLGLHWVPVDVLARAMAAVVALPAPVPREQWVFHFQSDTPRLAQVLEGARELSQRDWRERAAQLLSDPAHPSHPFRGTYFCLLFFFSSYGADVLLGVEFDGAGAGAADTRQTAALHGLSLSYTPEMLARVREELRTNLDAYVPPPHKNKQT